MADFRIRILVDADRAIQSTRRVEGALRRVGRAGQRTASILQRTRAEIERNMQLRALQESSRAYEQVGRTAERAAQRARLVVDAVNRVRANPAGLTRVQRGFTELNTHVEQVGRSIERTRDLLARPAQPGALRGALLEYRSARQEVERLQTAIERTATRFQRQPLGVAELQNTIRQTRELRTAVQQAGDSFLVLRRRVGQLRENQQLARLHAQARRTSGEISRLRDVAGRPLRLNTGRAERALSSLGEQARRTATLIRRSFVFFAGGVSGVLLIREIKELSDEYISLQNRLRLVTDTQANHNVVSRETLRIANETRQDWTLTTETFVRAAQATQALGRSQQELLTFTEAINHAVAISGATFQEARAGLIQLSQGIASGVLRGDELRSVMEQLRRANVVLLDHVRRTTEGYENFQGSLKDLAAQGIITSDFVVDAFLAAAPELAEEFGKLEITIAQALTRVRTAFTQFIGEINERTGIFRLLARLIGGSGEDERGGLAGVIGGLSGQVTVMIRVLALLSAALLGRLLNALGRSSVAFVRLQRDLLAARLGVARLNGVTGIAAVRIIAMQRAAVLARSAFALIGGPGGAILIAGLALLEYVRSTREASDVTEQLAQSIEDFTRTAQALNTVQLNALALGITDNIQSIESEVSRLEGRLQQLRQVPVSILPGIIGPDTDTEAEAERRRRQIILLEAELDTARQRLANTTERLGIVEDARNAGLEPGEAAAVASSQDFGNYLNQLRDELALLQLSTEERNRQVTLQRASTELDRELTGDERTQIIGLTNQIVEQERYNTVLENLTSRSREYEQSIVALNQVIERQPELAALARAEIQRLTEAYRGRQIDQFIENLRSEIDLLRVSADERERVNQIRAAERFIGRELEATERQRVTTLADTLAQEQRRAELIERLEGPLRQLVQLEEAVNDVIRERPDLAEQAIELLERERRAYEARGVVGILNSLREENQLLRENADVREILSAIRQREEELGRQFTESEREEFTRLAEENAALERTSQIYEQLAGPTRNYEQSLIALNEVLARHPELAEQAAIAEAQLRLEFLRSQQDFQSGLEAGFLQVSTDFTNAARNIENVIVNAFGAAENALVEFVQSGKLNFGDLVNSIIADLARLVIRQRILGPIAGLLGGILPGFSAGGPVGLPGFARGGPVEVLRLASGGEVTGPGGPTEDRVPALLSNGEFVVNAMATRAYRPVLEAINRKRFQSGGFVEGGGTSVVQRPAVQIFDQRTVSEGDEGNGLEVNQGGDGQLQVFIRDAVNNVIQRGDADHSLGQRFGSRPVLSPR